LIRNGVDVEDEVSQLVVEVVERLVPGDPAVLHQRRLLGGIGGATSLTTTAAPSLPNRAAVARPMLRPAPVTTATLPSRWATLALSGGGP
jgi:hypothetical protein